MPWNDKDALTPQNLNSKSGVFFNVKDPDFGATGDGTTDDRAAIAAADLAADSLLLFPEGVYIIASNITISNQCRFEPGAILTPSANVVITLTGNLEADLYQIFDLSASGSKITNTPTGQAIKVEWWGATGDDSTDSATAVQQALNHLRLNGGKLEFAAGAKYVMGSVITLIETVSNSAIQTWIIEGNGAWLDWSASGLTSGSLFKAGASSVSNVHEAGMFVVNNLKIVGPETQNPAVSGGVIFPTADGTTVGLELEWALDVELRNVTIRRCFKGFLIHRCWPFNTFTCNASGCYIGWHYATGCTLGSHIGDQAQACAYCILFQAEAADKTIHSQTFINFRCENSLRGITIDQLDGSAATFRTNIFIGLRFEQIAYDLFRVGQEHTFLTPESTGTDRTNFAQSCQIYGGRWSAPITSGTWIRVSGNLKVRGWDMVLPIGLESNITGSFETSRYFISHHTTGGSDSGLSRFRFTKVVGDLAVSNRLYNDSPTTLANDATPSVLAGNVWKTGGTTAITDFDNGILGQTIKILAAHSVKITDGSPIILAGSADYDMTVSDTLTLTMYDDQVWQEDSRSVN